MNGHSIQAPAGMTATTDMEFESGQFRVPDGIVSDNVLLKSIGPEQKVSKEIEKIIKDHSRISSDEIEKIMKLYGV